MYFTNIFLKPVPKIPKFADLPNLVGAVENAASNEEDRMVRYYKEHTEPKIVSSFCFFDYFGWALCNNFKNRMRTAKTRIWPPSLA
jgi:hypothetical protein